MTTATDHALRLKTPEGILELLALPNVASKKAYDYATSYRDWAEFTRAVPEYNDRLPLRWMTRPVAFFDAGYPPALQAIERDVPLLFVCGDLPSAPMQAVIGSRDAGDVGLGRARARSQAIAQGGAVVVSGMAPGVDWAAHEACLDAGGITVAVVPEPIDALQRDDRRYTMAARIIRGGGAIVSLIAPGAAANARRARPERNKVITGLAQDVYVAAAGETGGTLKAVGDAVGQGRTVLAAPEVLRLLQPQEVAWLMKHLGLGRQQAQQLSGQAVATQSDPAGTSHSAI